MEEFIHTLLQAVLVVVYILLTPLIIVITTPFILLWPGKKRMNGKREEKNIGARYIRILKLWREIGRGLPIL